METVYVTADKDGDTRTAEWMPTIARFNNANALHADDVKTCMSSFAEVIINRGGRHDFTKLEDPYRTQFYNDFRDKMEGRLDDFTKGQWYQNHVNKERHHLLDRAPEDVNFVDVIEMICDVVCAGKARTGEAKMPDLSAELLQKAYENTFNMVNDSVKIVIV